MLLIAGPQGVLPSEHAMAMAAGLPDPRLVIIQRGLPAAPYPTAPVQRPGGHGPVVSRTTSSAGTNEMVTGMSGSLIRSNITRASLRPN